MGKSKQMRIAIEKANNAAYLSVSPVKLGCGSWECRCDQNHSVPFKVKGKGGSVTIEILPAPRGLGLVAGRKIKNLLKMAGIKDAWTTAKGSTTTMNSTSKAVLECLRQHLVRVEKMAKAYLVIRIKGQADVPYWANTTLRLLKLEKKYRATILPIKENTDGMLKKIQHFISWQEIDMSTTKELLDKKGRRSGYKKITAEDISKAGFKTIDELATSLSKGK